MSSKELLREFGKHARSLFPLFRYLILQTETHAFCLALACAALIGFYPFCVLLLSIMQKVLYWEGGASVLTQAIQIYYPTSQDWLIENLVVSVSQSGSHVELKSIFWVFFGAAGVFIPLEAGFNRLWKVNYDRPYWLNQLVGFTLTAACCLLAIAFVAINAILQGIVGLPFSLLVRFSEVFRTIQGFSDHLILQVTAVCFFSLVILLFYKFLPNRHVETRQVLPAAILAGIVAEIVREIFVLVLPLMDIGSAQGSHGPFFVSVSFVVLTYFETFVVLGGAFLAAQKDSYPWMSLLDRFRKTAPREATKENEPVTDVRVE
jgi:membrane protein